MSHTGVVEKSNDQKQAMWGEPAKGRGGGTWHEVQETDLIPERGT